MKWLDDLNAIPSGSFARRFGLTILIGIGILMTAIGSLFWGVVGPIPFRFIPDVRPVVLLTSGLVLGLYAAGGGAARRKLALWGVVGYIIGFHLEEATVHWIGPFPGSITGTRVGIIGTVGSVLALVGVLLMHVEVERHKLARGLVSRGGDDGEAVHTTTALARVGTSRILGVATAIAGIAVLVRAGEAVIGDSARGGVYILFVGAALLLGLAFVLVRFVPKRA